MSAEDHINPDQPAAHLGEPPEDDFYEENGFVVFTASFLRRRGYCCDNGCRHCPYKETSISPEDA